MTTHEADHSHDVTWTNPVTYCGPGTTFKHGKCVGIHDDAHNGTCPAGQQMVDGACIDVLQATKTCKPFETGKFFDAAPVGVYEFVQSPFDCAKRCGDEKHSSHFVYSGNLKTCSCLNMKDVVDPTHEDAGKFAKCDANDKHQRVTLGCGAKFSMFDATRHDGKTYKALKQSMCHSKDATSPARLACDDPRQQFVRGETCNFDLGTHCGPGTALENGRCVLLQHDLLKKYARVPKGRCVVEDNPYDAHTGAEVQHTTLQAESEDQCMALCDETTPCDASVYDATHKTCDLVSHCLKIEETGDEHTTLFARSLPKFPKIPTPAEHCGRNTQFDGTKCVGTAAPEFCGKNSRLANGKCVAPDPPGPQVCRPGTRWLPESKQCARDISQGKIYCGKGTQWDGIQCTTTSNEIVKKAQTSEQQMQKAIEAERAKTQEALAMHNAASDALKGKDDEISKLREQMAGAARAKSQAVNDANAASSKAVGDANKELTKLRDQADKEKNDLRSEHRKAIEQLNAECAASKKDLRANLITQLSKGT